MKSDVVLPSFLSIEKFFKSINNEGFLVKSKGLSKNLINIREDWKIFNALNVFLNGNLFFKNHIKLFLNLEKELPLNSNYISLKFLKCFKNFKYNVKLSLFENRINNFFKFSNFHLLSLIMKKCYKNILIHKNSYKNYHKNN